MSLHYGTCLLVKTSDDQPYSHQTGPIRACSPLPAQAVLRYVRGHHLWLMASNFSWIRRNSVANKIMLHTGNPGQSCVTISVIVHASWRSLFANYRPWRQTG